MMKGLFVALILVLTSLNLFGQSKNYRAVAPKRLNKEITTSKNTFQIVDVRSEKEFKEKHIKSATNMDVNDSTFTSKIEQLDKNKPVYLYCRTGKRSETAAKILVEKGFENVYFLKGGVQKWEKKNFFLVN